MFNPEIQEQLHSLSLELVMLSQGLTKELLKRDLIVDAQLGIQSAKIKRTEGKVTAIYNGAVTKAIYNATPFHNYKIHAALSNVVIPGVHTEINTLIALTSKTDIIDKIEKSYEGTELVEGLVGVVENKFAPIYRR